MRIVVLDGYTLNPGDLSWEPLKSFGDVSIYDRTAPAQVRERAAGAEIVLTNKCPLNAPTLAELSALRFVGVLATGFNVVDTAAARARGIDVANVPAYSTPSVAQHVFALLLELTNGVARHAQSVASGDWSRCPDFAYWKQPLTELAGLTFGVIGYGRIGRATADLARAFGMRVLVHSRSATDSVSLDQLFRESDVISLHCPLTEQTKHLINAARLASMKPSAILINTSRGPLIDEPALAQALNEGKIAAAALDVLSVEPPAPSNPLVSAKNCLITPHLAWASRAARQRLLTTAIENVAAFVRGKPVNLVN
jgi:glycerate dehydrogenase